MKINVIGMILNNAGRHSFDAAVLDDNGRPMPAADSLHAMIMEYAKVFNGGTSDLVTLSREVLAKPEEQQPAVAQGAGEVVSDYYPELLIARSAVQELEQKVFSLEQCKAILQASVASYQRDMLDPPAYLQDAVIKAAGLGAMAEQIAAAKDLQTLQAIGEAMDALPDGPEKEALTQALVAKDAELAGQA